MAPKSKRKQQSEAAAAIGKESIKKIKNISSESQPSVSVQADTGSQPVSEPVVTPGSVSEPIHTQDSESQSQATLEPRPQREVLKQFSQEWLMSLDHDDTKSLAIFLCYNLAQHFSMKETEAAELTAVMIGKSDRPVRQWRSDIVLKCSQICSAVSYVTKIRSSFCYYLVIL